MSAYTGCLWGADEGRRVTPHSYTDAAFKQLEAQIAGQRPYVIFSHHCIVVRERSRE